MPIYRYQCPACLSSFEEHAGLDADFVDCPSCPSVARRAFYSGGISIKGPTVSMPAEPAERREQQKRQLKKRGWDYSRALEHLHNNIREDAQGRKVLDMRKANEQDTD